MTIKDYGTGEHQKVAPPAKENTQSPAPVTPAFVGKNAPEATTQATIRETRSLIAPPGPIATLRARLFDRAPLVARTMQEAGFTEAFYIGCPSLDKARFVYLPESGAANGGFTMQTATDEAEAQRILMECKAGRANA